MGYTNFWRCKPNLDPNKFRSFAADVHKILEYPSVSLYFEHDSAEPPLINDDEICFNGAGEDGHETFIFTRVTKIEDWISPEDKDNMAFAFCKTARKPYDKYVTACLILAKLYFEEDVEISSDGKISDWKEGLKIVNDILNYKVTMKGKSVEKAILKSLVLKKNKKLEEKRKLEEIKKAAQEEILKKKEMQEFNKNPIAELMA